MGALCSISLYLFNLAFKRNSKVEAWVNMLHGQTDFSFMLLLFECNQTRGENNLGTVKEPSCISGKHKPSV